MSDGMDASSPVMVPKTFAIENAVDSSVHVYVPRSQDAELMDLLRTSFVTHVQGSRMSGKSSLLVRTRESLRSNGVLALYASLDTVASANPSNALEAMRLLANTLARRARVPVPSVVTDDSILVPVDVLAEALRELARGASAEEEGKPSLVLLLDEIDSVAETPWAAGFFTTLRDLASRRGDDPTLTGVRIVIAGLRPFRHLVADPAASGVASPDATIWLDEFQNDAASAAALQEGFPPDLQEQAPALAWKALEFSGGYPQACTWLCRKMIAERLLSSSSELVDLEPRLVRLAERERRSSRPPLFFDFPEDYLQSYAAGAGTVADNNPHSTVQAALWAYLDLLAEHQVDFDSAKPAHLLLRWAGLARCDPSGMLRIRSPLLKRFYTLDWVHRVRRSVEVSSQRTRAPEGTPTPPNKSRAKRPFVSVLTTGGTIGMVEDSTGKVRAPIEMAELNRAYEVLDRIAEVEYRAVIGEIRDSANVLPEHWRQIALAVAEQVRDPRVAGVVVAHGTDTLAYTASAVAYALGDRLKKPVVFTGSQATVDVPHGDALVNLLRACKVAAEAGRRLPEVVICFDDKVLRACRAQKRDDRRFDAFESPICPPLAVVAEEIEYNDSEIRQHEGTPPPLEVRATFDSRILTITQVPGLLTALLEPVLDTQRDEDGLRAIIIQSLGAGNLPTHERFSLVDFIARAVRQDIPVVLTSPYPVLASNPEKYAPSEAAIRAGAVPIFNITLPALVTKLAWILGRMPRDLDHADPRGGLRRAWVDEHIRTNYVGETDDQPETAPGVIDDQGDDEPETAGFVAKSSGEPETDPTVSPISQPRRHIRSAK